MSVRSAAVRYGVAAPNFATPDRLVGLAVAAEGNGFDGFFLWDHVHREGDPPLPLSDTWTTLGAASLRTQTIRLGSWVTPLPRRRPQVLARQVVTVDHLSGGRVTLGVGLGSRGGGLGELERFGEDPDPVRRATLLDEGLDALLGAFSGERFSIHGDLVHVEQARFLPRPLQDPIPIWVACEWPHRRPLDRAARHDGVVPIKIASGEYMFMTPDDVRELKREIEERRTGSEPYDIAVLIGPPPHAGALEFEEAGATWLLAGAHGEPGWDDDLEEQIRLGPVSLFSP